MLEGGQRRPIGDFEGDGIGSVSTGLYRALGDLDEGRKRPQVYVEVNGSAPEEFRFRIGLTGLFLQPHLGCFRSESRRSPAFLHPES